MKVFLLLIFSVSNCFAYIPRGLLVLQKVCENNGSGTYQIEQEVQFQNNQDLFVLKEIWTVENENQMRLTVTGTKEFKDLIHLQFTYTNGTKYFQVNNTKYSQKLGDDFFEKYFHYRKTDNFANHLIAQKIVPTSIYSRKQVRSDLPGESFLRLSRLGGVVNYAFGTPVPAESSENLPGLWVEQDQFLIRKIRLASEAEIIAEKHSPYIRGLVFPRKRTIRWANNQVVLQTLNITGKASVSSSNLENNRLDGLDSNSAKSTIEEFYKRFR